MGALIAIIGILAVFGAPTYIIKKMLDLREKRLELESGARKELESGAMKELAAMREENRLLLARVEAMEDTIMSGDFELNQKLKEIAMTEGSAAALPKGSAATLPKADKHKLGTGEA